MAEETDVIVLGMGPGGEYVAGRLAAAGLDVVGVEAELVGGECPYWACVPSKMMVRAAGLLTDTRRVPGIAGSSQVHPDFGTVAARIRTEATDNWDDTVAADRFTGAGGRLVRGRGRLSGPGRVAVKPSDDGPETEYGARVGIVVATGSRPVIPPLEGLAGSPYWTNREAVSAESPPRSLLVLGGGPVGLELAQVYARFGTDVTVVEGGERLLSREEPESSRLITDVLTREGLVVHVASHATRVAYDDAHGFTLFLEDGEELTAERLLVATGRAPDLASLGLEHAGIELDPKARALPVDEKLLAAPALWAIGDVTGVGQFTHVAMYQGQLAARTILGEETPPTDYRALPHVTFTDPEIGSVGLTEAAARAEGIDVRTGIADLAASTRGWIHKAGNEGFIKLVADARRQVLVGATSAGPAGGEVLYGLAVAIQGEVPLERLRQMIYSYPTFHRAVETALADLS
ncbi:NAD(P)/FAD-dependent oxidoreductase [Streptomyces sp. XM4011]|uniref:Pyruvate/2-oxoglutarate dehydrogenase complex, dihydrolipoamide dehydrogenase (E3) component n=1 Tax=Streptomyces harbinensis TaxID=1176198 RepID=A0A1I6UT61_9ACTN|nr:MULTISPECIES: NAD(P)/FAD-dependent oxidoreductase [Streptomyces]MCK1812785.1 NAD(P)/FAD-dependent oxidoreductase [Streptomyces sp. XM4011]SFT04682.1 Pyruvate/2-oxoglutarate dehydrogenase complex, dihydrolipoamide dehydrogenase (E3) component [Streptomyces harbinensis]